MASRVTRKLPSLRRVRDAQGLSLRELSGRSGVSFVNISRLEHGQPATVQTAEKLARALKVPVAELLEHGSSSDTLLDMAGFVRSLGYEPDSYFTEVTLPTEEVHKLYESTYIRLLTAEKRVAEDRWDEPFDSGLGDRLVKLAQAEDRLPSSEENKRLRERVGRLAKRVAEVYQREAEHLQSESAEVIELAAGVRRPRQPKPENTGEVRTA